MKKRCLSILLALTLCLSLLPVGVGAYSSAADKVTVAGVELTNGKYLVNGGNTATETKPNDNYAYFHVDNNGNAILTLHNYNYTMESGDHHCINWTGELTIKLDDNTVNSVTNNRTTSNDSSIGSDKTVAIQGEGNNSLTIQGPGTLNAKGYKHAIWATSAITIQEGATVTATATATDADGSIALSTNNHGTITINNATVTATGGQYGIGYSNSGEGSLTIDDNSKVTATGNTAAVKHTSVTLPTNGHTSTANTTASSEGAAAYDPSKISTYKYISFDTTSSKPAASYDLWVGGVQVTDANKDNILGDTDGGATATYNSDTTTLTLNGANITGAKIGEYDKAVICTEIPNLTLRFSGQNTLSGDIRSIPQDEKNTFTVEGIDSTSTLNVSGSFAPFYVVGDMDIKGTGAVSSVASEALTEMGMGTYVTGALTISGGIMLEAGNTSSTDTDSLNIFGIFAIGGINAEGYQATDKNGKVLYLVEYPLSEEDTLNAKVYSATSGGSDYAPFVRLSPAPVTPSDPPSSNSGPRKYGISVLESANGAVEPSKKTAAAGSTVTVTVKPDDSYVLGTLLVTDKDGKERSLTDNGDGTYTFSMPRGKVTIQATFVPDACDGGETCPSTLFTDLDLTLWYHEGIDYVVTNGLMNGTSETSFSPDLTTNRAMIVTILHRLEGQPTGGTMPFLDVIPGQYYYDAVAWAAQNGIVTGYDAVTFGAEDTLSREQLAAILYRYAQYKDWDLTSTGDLTAFSDAWAVSPYAVTALRWAVGKDIVGGYNGLLTPGGSAQRCEAAAMLMRFLQDAEV